jgi:hypothetical protein
MPEILLFHRAQVQTPFPRVCRGAQTSRPHGHAPDLYQGLTFDTLEEGVAHTQNAGFETIIERGLVAAAELPNTLVYGGFSLGVMPAQMLAQTRLFGIFRSGLKYEGTKLFPRITLS